MSKNDKEKAADQQNSQMDAEKQREAWLNKNMPLVIGLGMFLLIALAAFAMKMCG